MEESDIDFIAAHKRWKFHLSFIWNYYWFLIGPIGLFVVGILAMVVSIFPFKLELFIMATLMLGFGIFTILLCLRSFRDSISFREFRTALSQEKNLELAIQTIMKIKWNLINKERKYLIATTKVSGFSWGEEVTAIILDSRILLNCKPSNQPITIFRASKKIKAFINLFEMLKAGESVRS